MESGAQAKPETRVEGLKALLVCVLHEHKTKTRVKDWCSRPPTTHQIPIAPTAAKQGSGYEGFDYSPLLLDEARCRRRGAKNDRIPAELIICPLRW
jgi:hypothetical protein